MLFNHFPLYPENPHNLWNAPAVMALLERHPSAKIWLDGHNHDGNYGARAGIHYVNLKAMLDTEETSYARLDFFADTGGGARHRAATGYDAAAAVTLADPDFRA